MITIPDILRARDVDLHLKAATQEEAIFRVAALLKEDKRINDWQAFYDGLTTKNPCFAAGSEFEICIPHVRTDAVNEMVMSAGRSESGILLSGKKQVHYVFAIGLPAALASDYLRIIGALARIFRNGLSEKELRKADTAEQFIATLAENEMKL